MGSVLEDDSFIAHDAVSVNRSMSGVSAHASSSPIERNIALNDLWRCSEFEFKKTGQRLACCISAHLISWPEPLADQWTFWFAKEFAAIVVGQLDAAHASRLAIGHARNRR